MPVNSFENYPMSWKPARSDLAKPYYLSIASLLESDILSGSLSAHTKLPPQRELADYLDLNLSTITRAYKLCELKGLLYAVTGKGTFVSPGVSSEDTFLERGRPVIEMGIIKPFYETNPAIWKASQAALSHPEAVHLFEYSNPFGSKRQLEAARKWLALFGIQTGSENILLTTGAQNALSIILISLFHPGDKIAVDNFTYTNFKGLANLLQIQLVAVGTDRFGMRPEALSAVCRQTNLRGIYLMPTCCNPTGTFMPMQRRRDLSDIIQKYDLLVIEDDIYSFLAPCGTEHFFSMLPEQTIHVCSTSKSLCAGLRVAFIAFPKKYREPLCAGMLNINLKTVSLNAEIIAELIDSGGAEKIVQEKIALARRRNQIYRNYFGTPQTDNIERFFHWIPLPGGMTSEEFELTALRQGVHVLGSHRFALHGHDDSSYIRISITSPDTESDLKTGLQILQKLLEERQLELFV